MLYTVVFNQLTLGLLSHYVCRNLRCKCSSPLWCCLYITLPPERARVVFLFFVRNIYLNMWDVQALDFQVEWFSFVRKENELRCDMTICYSPEGICCLF